VAVLKPEGDLFDGGLLQVVGQGGLARAGSGAGHDVTAGVGDASDGRVADRVDAVVAKQVNDAGLLDPAVGFVFFQLKLGDGFEGVSGKPDFGLVGGKGMET